MALSPGQLAQMNKPQADQQKEQLDKLYQRLYPRMLKDFSHLDDIKIALARVSAELAALHAALISHTHISAAPSNPTGPGLHAPLSPNIPLEDTVGRSKTKPSRIETPESNEAGVSVTIDETRIDFDTSSGSKPFSAVEG